MKTPFSTQMTALSIALLMNGLMIGGVAYLFSGRVHAGPVLQASTLSAPSAAESALRV
jgi:hypothetical protein